MDPPPRSPAAPDAPPFWQRPLDELLASLLVLALLVVLYLATGEMAKWIFYGHAAPRARRRRAALRYPS